MTHALSTCATMCDGEEEDDDHDDDQHLCLDHDDYCSDWKHKLFSRIQKAQVIVVAPCLQSGAALLESMVCLCLVAWIASECAPQLVILADPRLSTMQCGWLNCRRV